MLNTPNKSTILEMNYSRLQLIMLNSIKYRKNMHINLFKWILVNVNICKIQIASILESFSQTNLEFWSVTNAVESRVFFLMIFDASPKEQTEDWQCNYQHAGVGCEASRCVVVRTVGTLEGSANQTDVVVEQGIGLIHGLCLKTWKNRNTAHEVYDLFLGA